MKLLEPVSIPNLKLHNRIVAAPIATRMATNDGFVTQKLIEHYVELAKGGVSLIIVEPAIVSPWKRKHALKICSNEHIAGIKELVNSLRPYNVKVALQLIHGLPQTKECGIENLSVKEIKRIQKHFLTAIERAEETGFDAVELHCCHHSTLANFLSLTNKRQDEYGKTICGRARFVTEIIQTVKSRVGEEFPLGCRIDGDEFIVRGNTLKQTREIGRSLAECGVDFLDISAGGRLEDAFQVEGKPIKYGYSGDRMCPSHYMPDATNTYLAADIREFLRNLGHNTPIITAGKIPAPDIAETVLQKGQADLIGLARALLIDPYWARKAEEGRNDIIRCSYCNFCLELNHQFKPVICPKKRTRESLPKR